MAFFLLYLGEGVQFHQAAVIRAVAKIPGVYDLQTGGEDNLKFKFDFASDSTIARLKRDLESIAIDGQGDASMQVALEIQKNYDAPIHMIDEAYSFDLVLLDFRSLVELKNTILKAQGG